MALKSIPLAMTFVAFTSAAAFAVSVGELSRQCGDDAKAYCDGVGYGNPMQQCLAKSYKKLKPQCKAIMDRLDGGEKVTLF